MGSNDHHESTALSRESFLSPVSRSALAEDVYLRIRNAIFSDELASGARINVEAIARALDVSSQPVKEAIQRLGLERLVVIKPRVGTFVRTITREDVVNILNARLMFESYAVQHLPSRLSSRLLNRLEDALTHLEALTGQQPFPFLLYNEYDITFHETLVDYSGPQKLDNLGGP
ncbi:MAG: GntR family transcriptional regulator [Firmicutes bacterium]|nr:GntR family transcriptional regulator [Bacillota bacterium]